MLPDVSPALRSRLGDEASGDLLRLIDSSHERARAHNFELLEERFARRVLESERRGYRRMTVLLHRFRDSIETRLSAFESWTREQFRRNDERFHGIERRLDSIETRSEERFQQFERRFQEVDRRFEQIDLRFEQVDRRFEQIDHRFEQVDRRFEKIDHSFERVDHRFERMDDRFESLQSSLIDIYRQIAVQTRWIVIAVASSAALAKLLDWLIG